LGKKNQTEKAVKRSAAASAEPITVSGRWLAGALGAVLLLAALCAYGTLALLFYQGQWQIVLHPVNTITATPQVRFDEIHFDATETGVTQLDGWWIPAEPGSRWARSTILYLHGGAGSLSDSVPDLAALHALGINVFAFDYRGYGKSAGPYPDEARMTADADAAWSYLTETRHLDSGAIVIYGTGVGASLAAELAARHTPGALIVDAPSEAASKIVGRDARARILPRWLLLTERFDPAETLETLTVPKLFLDRNGSKPRTEELYRLAASPKNYFELQQDNGYQATLERFLDSVLR
jgi:pimeloyl-ACP methyl ester carboxylesterase